MAMATTAVAAAAAAGAAAAGAGVPSEEEFNKALREVLEWSMRLHSNSTAWRPTRSDRNAISSAIDRLVNIAKAFAALRAQPQAPLQVPASASIASKLAGDENLTDTDIKNAKVALKDALRTFGRPPSADSGKMHAAFFLPVGDRLFFACGYGYGECELLRSPTPEDISAKRANNDVPAMAFVMVTMDKAMELTDGGVVHRSGNLYRIPLEMMEQLHAVNKHANELEFKELSVSTPRATTLELAAAPALGSSGDTKTAPDEKQPQTAVTTGAVAAAATVPPLVADVSKSAAVGDLNVISERGADEWIKPPGGQPIPAAPRIATRSDPASIDVRQTNKLLTKYIRQFDIPAGKTVSISLKRDGPEFFKLRVVHTFDKTIDSLEIAEAQVRRLFESQFQLILPFNALKVTEGSSDAEVSDLTADTVHAIVLRLLVRAGFPRWVAERGAGFARKYARGSSASDRVLLPFACALAGSQIATSSSATTAIGSVLGFIGGVVLNMLLGETPDAPPAPSAAAAAPAARLAEVQEDPYYFNLN